MGIDPGYAIIGYGIVDYEKGKFNTVNYGAVTTKSNIAFESRLEIIFNDITELITKYRPNAISLEKLFFNTNTSTAIDVAQARGVILLAAKLNSVDVFEYTPLQVKQAVTGYGRAEKSQIMDLTKRLLNLPRMPKPDDTADALALAVCHAYVGASALNKLLKEI